MCGTHLWDGKGHMMIFSLGSAGRVISAAFSTNDVGAVCPTNRQSQRRDTTPSNLLRKRK